MSNLIDPNNLNKPKSVPPIKKHLCCGAELKNDHHKFCEKNSLISEFVKQMSGLKYLCQGEFTDGHYISAKELPELYGVPPEQCAFVDPMSSNPVYLMLVVVATGKLIRLKPDSSGVYTLPNA